MLVRLLVSVVNGFCNEEAESIGMSEYRYLDELEQHLERGDDLTLIHYECNNITILQLWYLRAIMNG